MSTALLNPRHAASARASWIVAGGMGLLAAVVLLSRWLAADVGDTLTRNTVRLSLAWYAVALLSVMRLSPADWSATTAKGHWARWCWTWALACFWVHLAMAFHYYHHWSHADAFERTRRVSGLGEGLYISYLFTLLWTIDVLWWWIAPQGYRARSAWIDRLLHAFMLFIVFNSMVVFETGPIRWAGLAMFVLLTLACTAARRPSRAPSPKSAT
ncbi:MAG: hypothetical protein K2Y37_18850 [Pirellulales bacterium]|nr:hypothetical protein [Pirellulales bacterium]